MEMEKMQNVGSGIDVGSEDGVNHILKSKNLQEQREAISHFVFIDGLPGLASKKWFQQLFGIYKDVMDTYVLRRARHGRPRPFTFVRYRQSSEGKKAIQELKGKMISN